jgi:hypothetical protein
MKDHKALQAVLLILLTGCAQPAGNLLPFQQSQTAAHGGAAAGAGARSIAGQAPTSLAERAVQENHPREQEERAGQGD